jgi:hypothetical protein
MAQAGEIIFFLCSAAMKAVGINDSEINVQNHNAEGNRSQHVFWGGQDRAPENGSGFF